MGFAGTGFVGKALGISRDGLRRLAIGKRRIDYLALAVLFLLVAVDALFFSRMAVLRFLSHHADAFDMGIEDQAMWSTLHGNLFGVTLERRLTSNYLGYHVEPISIVGPLLYLVYASPISLVVFKNVALALGAIPAYWLARKHLDNVYAGLVFAAAYLLFPGLEAAGLYDFHAYTLTAPLLLAAFAFLEARRFGWLLVFLVLSSATKENSPLDAVPLGLYLAVRYRERLRGLAAAVVGVAWFSVCTYIIIPHFNTEGQGWLWTRYGGMGGSPFGALAYFAQHPNLLIAPVPSDPNWLYMARLLAPVAWLTLLSPTALFLMGPALAVNILTTYEPMHLIETYHYSAHLVPYVILGAVYAVGTLATLGKRLRIPWGATVGLLCTAVLAGTLVYHHYRGYTPLSGEYVSYSVTAHDRLGEALAQQFTASVPLNAPLSAQGNQYPHLSHRPNIWMFPEVDTAQYIFLDLSTLPNNPGIYEGIHDQVRAVLTSGQFGPIVAEDGYLILQRGAPPRPLPDSFFSFARANSPRITHPLDVWFGNDLEFLGYDVLPDRDGKVNLRAYWRARQPIQQDLFLPFFITDGKGHEVGATLHREPVNYWYPTNRWKPGEVIQITTYNLPIGRAGQDFGVAIGAQPNNNPWNTAGRLRPIVRAAPAPLRTPGYGTLLEIISFHNDHYLLTPVVSPLRPAVQPRYPLAVNFAAGVGLAGYDEQVVANNLDLTLYWTAHGPTEIPYTVFAHVLDPQGKVIAQHDAPPDGGLKSTTAWLNGELIPDHLAIPLPPGGLVAGDTIEFGMYDPVTGHRLTAQLNGKTVDHIVIGIPAAR